ncbi:four helix bundle protein [Membranihabitans marinus]
MISRDIAVATYKTTLKFRADEKFGLISQLRRVSISIASNIAEGSSRKYKKIRTGTIHHVSA